VSAVTQERTAAVAGTTRGGGLRGLGWLTWRQHRWPIVAGAAVTAGLAVWMLMTANKLHTLAQHNLTISRPQIDDIAASYATYQMNTVVFLPVLLAVFWGVPMLAREYEQRTLPLAWSQDLSPQRWLWGKTGILTVLVGVFGTVLAGVSEYTARQYHAYTGRSLFEGTAFQAGGWMPLTLALAWLAVGIAAGAATRRVMPAMAVVAAAWIGRMVLMVRLRPEFMAPMTLVKRFDLAKGGRGMLDASSNAANDMGLSGNDTPFVDAHGHQVSQHLAIDGWCGTPTPGGPRGTTEIVDPGPCLQRHGIVGELVKFQPASRMGTFHLIENGLNLGLMVVALGVAWWCVRRTRTTV
jgi:hypothetical protein